MWVKICGTTNLEDARVAVDAGADALGFIFAPSPRRLSPKDAKKIIAELPKGVEKVGVFVNQKPEIILDTVETAGLTGVQLHGDEEAEFIRELHKVLPRPVEIYNVVPINFVMNSLAGKFIGDAAREFIHAVLVDSSTSAKRGGTGNTYDWDAAAPFLKFVGKKYRLVMAGGLRPENVRAAIDAVKPWGVDVVSGVEKEPGKKDHEKVRAFVKAAKAAAAQA